MATQTKEEVLETLKGMMPELQQAIAARAKEVLDSGAIELSDFEFDGKFKLPTMLLSVVLENLGKKYGPPHPSSADKKFMKNLRDFI